MIRIVGFAVAIAVQALSLCAQADGEDSGAPARADGGNPVPSLYAKVLALTPAYRNPALQRYVNAIGQKVSLAVDVIDGRPLAGGVTITVLDKESRNAFTLGDRLVFLDRGLLPFLDSEAELAAVIAMELAHLSLRSTFDDGELKEDMRSAPTLAGLASSLASIGALLSPRAWMEGDPLNRTKPPDQDATARAIARARKGPSPSSELSAVTRATAYLAQAGYSTAALPAALNNLRRADQSGNALTPLAPDAADYHASRALGPQQVQRQGYSAGDVGPDAFTEAMREGHILFQEHLHLDPQNKDDQSHKAGQHRQRPGTVNREGFLAEIEGTILGPPIHEGVVRGESFYHRGLAVSLACPPRWSLANFPTHLLCTNPNGDAVVQINVLDYSSDDRLDVILEDALGSGTLERARWDYSAGPARFKATARAQTPFGTTPADFVMTSMGEHAFVFTLSTRGALDRAAHATTLDAIATSLRPIVPDDAKALPVRLALVRANGSVDLESIATNAGAPVDAVLALNGANRETKPAAGSLVKMPL